MGWWEQKIRRYEHRRWAAEPNRRVLPFAWGLEHIGGSANEKDPRGFLDRFVRETTANSERWFASGSPLDPRLEAALEGSAWKAELTFTSSIPSPWGENNRVFARFFPAKGKGPAVVVLPQWNADSPAHVDICRWLNRWGITALRLSLPYHDRRAVPGHARADYIVGPNIGLTLQANRQAVCDARSCVHWLAREGYGPLGILGTSLGSSISCITTSHEPLIRAAALLHVSSYFGDVVANGMTTMNVWESLGSHVTEEQLRHYWEPISPLPYLAKLSGRKQKLLAISGKYDPTFWYKFSEQFFLAVRDHQVPCDIVTLPCGHYSLGEAPFKWMVGWRFGRFLASALG